MTAVLAAAALGIATLGTAAIPAHASTAPAKASAAKTAALGPDAAASLQAKQTGKPVVVTADDTATDTVIANANGSFTLDRSELPTRAKKNNAWVPVSAALEKNSDGTISPTAVNTTLAFSGGGTTPLVSYADGQGHTLSLTWPNALPVPTISGDTATYANVYPGADLAVTATSGGGFTDVIVIHDAAAAANPALANIKLGTHTTGLNLTTGTDGALTATDSKTGATVFTAPPASMWDSTAAAAPAGKTKELAAVGSASLSGLDQAPTASTAQVPGSAAHRAAVKVTAGPGSLTLTGDQSALDGQGTPSFPEFLDPSVTVGRQDWDYVSEAYPNQSYWDGAGSQEENIGGTEEYVARVGYNNSDSSSNEWAWSYFDFNLSSLAGTDITSALLQLTQVAASQPSVGYTMYAAASGPITSSTDYSHYPGTVMAAHSVTASGNGQYNMDVTSDVVGFVGGGGGVLTYEVYETSTNPNSYRWLANNPSIAVTYWHTPAVPTSPTITTGGATVPCSTNSAAPTLIAKSSGGSVSLNVTSSTADVGYSLYGNDYISTNGATAVLSSTPSLTAQSGNNTLTLSNYALADGDTYAWYATASNGTTTSGPDTTCYFRADETSPVMSTVISTSFPTQGGGETQGQAGNFTFSATDPGTNPVGIASFHYNLGGTYTGTSSVNASSSSATVSVTPPSWGTNTLWVAAIDAAGNQSQPMAYSFFVPAPAYTPGVTGDITDTGKADLLAVDDAGNLRIYPDPQPANVAVSTGSTTTDPLQAGGTILISGKNNPLWPNATFAGSLVAHGGSFTGGNVDDLMFLHNGTFYVAANPGAGTGWSTPVTITKPATCTVPTGFTYSTCAAAGYSPNWSAVKQMIDVPPATASGKPALITIEENAGVWGVYYYAATATGINFTAPVLLSVNSSAWNWGTVTPVYAGDANSDGKPDLMVRSSTGAIAFFSNIEAGVNQDPNTAQVTVGNTGSAYTPSNYPYIASDQAIYNSDPTLWAVAANGTLTAIPVTPGATPAFGTPLTISSSGWGNKLQEIENSYAPVNNVGVAKDGTAFTAANSYDGTTSSLSATALQSAFTMGNALTPLGSGPIGSGIYDQNFNSINGLQPDATIVTNDGFDFSWPGYSPNTPDNYTAVGQTIAAPINLNGTQDNILSFLGGATGNTAGVSGTAKLTWSDGTTENITLSFNDWALGGGAPATPNPVIGSTATRDVLAGTSQATTVYLFDDTVALSPPTDGAQLAAITLPNIASGSAIHIFGVATQTVAVSGTAPTITSPATAAFTTGTAGSYSVVTTGSPAPTVTETGTLPAGLTFTAGSGTGTISGTATAAAAGTYPVTISASNAAGTANQSLTITVTAAQAPAITSAATATFTSGTAGSYNVTTTGVPTPAVTETGTLPAGLTFTPGTGTASITGTATTAGTYPVTITATSTAGTATLSLTITVTGPPVVPAITSSATTTFSVGTAGTYTVTTTGTPSPAITETGTLPTGLTFNAGTGTATITGTATTAGSYPVTITATNSAGHATLALTITVSSSTPAPTHKWTLSTGSGDTVADTAGSDTITLNGGYSWVAGTTRGTVVGFDGNSAYGETATNAVNTSGSFTVSAWVDLSSLPSGNVTAVSEFGTNNSPFYLQYNGGSWAFALSNNDTASPTINGAGGPSNVVAGTWYHIVGVYNASTQTAYIYVNGASVGSQSGLTTWNCTGDLDIGRDLYTGLQVDYFPGQISTVETWNSALTAAQVASLS